MKEGTQNLVGCPRIDIVRSQKKEALRAAPFFAHEILDGWDGLLIRSSAGVEHILLHFFALVLHGVKQKTIEFLKYRQHRFARNGCPATEDDRNLVLAQKLARLFREQRPVRRRIDDDRLELASHHAATL